VASVVFEGVSKLYGTAITAVRDMNLRVEDREFMVLVGPSGCGKSTALRMVAGLEEITEGRILIGDRVINQVPPKDRDIAMVFQSYALYPHMSVYDNLAFGLRQRRTPRPEIDRRVHDAARVLDMEDLLTRKPRALSGGQRQRVALGRAIVRQPKAFLMDEPLSNLDAKLRVQTRVEILKLHRRLEATFIYVTHDQVEAMTMGDRIAVLKGGVLQQVDTPQALYERPVNIFVAGFMGSPSMNFLRLAVADDGPALRAEGLHLPVPAALLEAAGAAPGQEFMAGLRPEHLLDGRYAEPGLARLRSRVEVVEMLGSEIYAYLTAAGQPLTARLDVRSGDLHPGQEFEVAVRCECMHLFDARSEGARANGMGAAGAS
jgi:multiple sugar transport system ATP-binding protein